MKKWMIQQIRDLRLSWMKHILHRLVPLQWNWKLHLQMCRMLWKSMQNWKEKPKMNCWMIMTVWCVKWLLMEDIRIFHFLHLQQHQKVQHWRCSVQNGMTVHIIHSMYIRCVRRLKKDLFWMSFRTIQRTERAIRLRRTQRIILMFRSQRHWRQSRNTKNYIRIIFSRNQQSLLRHFAI